MTSNLENKKEINIELFQTKLTKSEWDYTEIPESEEELEILELIKKGYSNVNIKYNNSKSLIGLLKTSNTEEIMKYLYNIYFKKKINELIIEYELSYSDEVDEKEKKKTIEKIKKVDEIRIKNNDNKIDNDKIYEYILLDLIENILYYSKEKKANWYYYYYSLKMMMMNDIENINTYVINFIKYILEEFESKINMKVFIKFAYNFIERNEYLFKYQDYKLYEHQKQIFTICKRPNPKLVLYIAPTGTGKTLTPLGLCEKIVIEKEERQNKVIFVCAARHVGLALAKSAISAKKKIAFAFGCNSISDIRLHFFAAKEAIRDKNGNIRKVDNSVGDNVELMISDIKSYNHAMLYMKAFNKVENMILYLDEPTITMDYEEHEFHKIIKRNWLENEIPNVILSSATLPHYDELKDTICDFKRKFHGAEVESIISHDCVKSIPIVNKDCYVELPHFLFEKYEDIIISANHCEKYKTLLRYFDLRETVKFIIMINEKQYYTSERYRLDRYFNDIGEITMASIKSYYLLLLKNIKVEKWNEIFEECKKNREKLHESNIYFTTGDAHTLTDGPTIFLTEDVDKIAKFVIQNTKIPLEVIEDIKLSIEHNNILSNKMEIIEKQIQDIMDKKSSSGGEEQKKKLDRIISDGTKDTRDLQNTLNELRGKVQSVSLNDLFIPNRLPHIKKWANKEKITNEFSSRIEDDIVEKIMLLPMEDYWKILLLMGIGAMTNHQNKEYNEIMKELAQKQKLYVIIASSDYIYGTNYQFCHEYISKDLSEITQEKAIQAMGRVGRNKLQQDYTIRFRDNELIKTLFVPSSNKPEVNNMNRLLSLREL